MDNMRTKNESLTEAVVLSTHTMGYGVIRSLGIMGVPITAVYYNKSDIGYLSKYVKNSVKSPHPEKNEAEFIELLLNIGKKKQRPILIPANDETIVPIAKYKSALEKYFVVACTNYETMIKFVSKENTYRIAEENNIPLPKTFKPLSLEHLKAISEQISFPCLVKPSQSHLYYNMFKRKMLFVKDFNEMQMEYKNVIKNRLECVIQEYIPGDECAGINFNSYRHADSYMINFTARKIRYSEGGIGIPTCVISSDNIPEVTEQSIKLLSALSYRGYSCIEYKFDMRDGKYKLMEMNGRHNRSTLLSLLCGINFPWIEYTDLIFNEKIKEHEYEKGLYWIDFLKDLESLPKRLVKDHYSVIKFFNPYFNKNIFSDISLLDLKPTIKRFSDICLICINAIFKTIKNVFNKSKGSIDYGRTD